MNGFLVRTGITALGLLIAAVLVPGIHVSGIVTLLLAAALFGFINSAANPLLERLTLPLSGTVLLLALLIINAVMLGLTALLLPGMQVSSILATLLGTFIVSAVAWGASRYVTPDGRITTSAVRKPLSPPRY